MSNRKLTFELINNDIIEKINKSNKYNSDCHMKTIFNFDELSKIKIFEVYHGLKYFTMFNLKIFLDKIKYEYFRFDNFKNTTLPIDDLKSWKNNLNDVIICYSKKKKLYLIYYYNKKNILKVYYLLTKKLLVRFFLAICFEYEFENTSNETELKWGACWNEEIYEYQWARNLDYYFDDIKDFILNLS